MRKILFICHMFACQILLGQTISTVAGTGVIGYSGDGGNAKLATLKNPSEVKVDKHGNIYFADLSNHAVRKVNTLGVISTIAGTGIAGYSGDGEGATNATLNEPIGVAVDDNDNVFIADKSNQVIRKINPAGIISTFAGTGAMGYSGDGGAATGAQLNAPYSIVIDNNGDLLFSDAGNHVVRKIDEAGIISTVAGCGVGGSGGDGGPATIANLRYPGFLTIHPKTGALYIPDHANKKVRKLGLDGIITTVAGSGVAGNDGDGGLATLAKLNAPNSACFDTAGNLFIGDSYAHVIRMVDNAGIISTIAGTGSGGFNGDGNPATATQLNNPNGLAIDVWGNLYFADSYNNRIRRINYNTSSIKDVAYSPINVTIAPNPASNEISITAEVVLYKITVINVLGQTVVATNGIKKQMAIDIRFLSPGLYTVKVNNAYAGRFVKE